MGLDAMVLIFWMLSFKPTFSLSPFTFIKRLFSSSSLSAVRVVSSAHLRLLIFLPQSWLQLVLHPAQHFSWCTLPISWGFVWTVGLCVHAQSLQLCPALCDPVDCSPPGSSVPGILQSRIWEWVAFSNSRGSSQPRDQTCVVSCIFCISGRFFTPEAKKPDGEMLTQYF